MNGYDFILAFLIQSFANAICRFRLVWRKVARDTNRGHTVAAVEFSSSSQLRPLVHSLPSRLEVRRLLNTKEKQASPLASCLS